MKATIDTADTVDADEALVRSGIPDAGACQGEHHALSRLAMKARAYETSAPGLREDNERLSQENEALLAEVARLQGLQAGNQPPRLSSVQFQFIKKAWEAIPPAHRTRTRKRVALGMALGELERIRAQEQEASRRCFRPGMESAELKAALDVMRRYFWVRGDGAQPLVALEQVEQHQRLMEAEQEGWALLLVGTARRIHEPDMVPCWCGNGEEHEELPTDLCKALSSALRGRKPAAMLLERHQQALAAARCMALQEADARILQSAEPPGFIRRDYPEQKAYEAGSRGHSAGVNHALDTLRAMVKESAQAPGAPSSLDSISAERCRYERAQTREAAFLEASSIAEEIARKASGYPERQKVALDIALLIKEAHKRGEPMAAGFVYSTREGKPHIGLTNASGEILRWIRIPDSMAKMMERELGQYLLTLPSGTKP